MSRLNFEPSSPSRRGSKKPFKLILGSVALVGTIALGSTLAASINLNDSGPVEFGQGVARTVVCGGANADITITPFSSFANSEGGGNFIFTSFEVTGIPSRCDGATFTFKFYGTSSTPLTPTGETFLGIDPGKNLIVNFSAGDFGANTTGSGFLWDDSDFTITNKSESSFKINLNVNPGINPDNLYSITVETGGSTNTLVYNGHYYQYINEPMYWNDAFDATAGCLYTMELDGQTLCGYFAQINSQSENDYLVNKVYETTGENLDAWFGAADDGGRTGDNSLYGGWNEGDWRWVMGPNAGTTINFTNWSEEEPNNASNGVDETEEAAELYGNSGTWNDLSNYASEGQLGFLVEFSTDFLVP